MHQNEKNQAIEYFERTADDNPNPTLTAWAHVYLGRLAMASGKPEKATDEFKTALKMDGTSAMAKDAAEKALEGSSSGSERRNHEIFNWRSTGRSGIDGIAGDGGTTARSRRNKTFGVTTQKELEALQKVQAAAQSGNPDEELAAVNNVLENFTDTDYKPMLISMGMQAAQQKDDMALIATWVERAEQEDPNSIEAHVIMAEAVARHTRENDLDKADSIKKIQTNANRALDLLKTTNSTGRHSRCAMARNQEAASPPRMMLLAWPLAWIRSTRRPSTNLEFGVAADPSASVLKARLAKSYVDNKEYDAAITTADQILADGTAPPAVKQFAQAQKDAATKMKAAAK